MKIPSITLGVYRQSSKDAYSAVERGIELGYRSIDTAAYYGNEGGVGRAVIDSAVPRDEIFVTSKIWNSDQGKHALEALKRSLDTSGLDYFDCYLLHWPVRGLFQQTWEVLQDARDQGLVTHLGVSNFLPRHLQALAETRVAYTPYINQVEMHPYLLPSDILAYDASHGILTSSWSPLGNGYVLRDQTLQSIGNKYAKSASQIALRWAIQHGVHVIPKASSVEHLTENLSILDFELSDEDMQSIDALNRNEHTDWDPHSA